MTSRNFYPFLGGINNMNVVNIDKQIYEIVQDLPSYDYMLGRTLMQPFRPANSGSRALMSSIHAEHLMIPSKPEVPIVQTGYETKFGEASTSFVEAKGNWEVVFKINKFTFNNNHYYLIVSNRDTGIYDVWERVTYKHNTESYGYMWDNSRLDNLSIGDYVNDGEIIKTSKGFDEFGNKMNGVNLVTMYLSCAQNMEDSIIISQTAAKKLETNLVKNTSITINDNDILLNLYGGPNTNEYKTFPDIGQRIRNGIFCGIRRLENENILFSLSQQRLRDIMISDRCILMDGYVADIDVYCNNAEALGDSTYNQQLYKYYQERVNFSKTFYDLMAPIAMNAKMTYNLEELYATCRDTILGKQFFKDKQFNNVIIEVTVMQPLLMEPGDKLADRYGGKGVVSQILPDEQMPILDNGERVDIIKNQSTCINRENIGQLHEQSLTFIGMRILDYIKDTIRTMKENTSYCELLNLWLRFVSMVDKDQADMCTSMIDFYDEQDCKMFIDSIFEDDGIILSSSPFTTPINIDTIEKIYDEFDFIEPYKVLMPMEDSNGNIRFVPSRRKLVVGKIYNYRLKQYAEEKFSVTSLSATNLKNLNTRSKANKIYETKYTKTPIMFGFMESGDLSHLGMQYVVMNLMLYSSSPQARRLFEELLIGNPYDVNIMLDKDSKNRNAEIINALLKTMGLKLVFNKKLKEAEPMYKNILYKTVHPKDYKPKTNIREIIGNDDLLDIQYSIMKQNKFKSKPMYKNIMIREVDENGKPIYKTNIREVLDGVKDEQPDECDES